MAVYAVVVMERRDVILCDGGVTTIAALLLLKCLLLLIVILACGLWRLAQLLLLVGFADQPDRRCWYRVMSAMIISSMVGEGGAGLIVVEAPMPLPATKM